MLVISIIHLTTNQPPDKKTLSGRQKSHPFLDGPCLDGSNLIPLLRGAMSGRQKSAPCKGDLVWTAGFPPLLRWALCGRQDSHPS